MEGYFILLLLFFFYVFPTSDNGKWWVLHLLPASLVGFGSASHTPQGSGRVDARYVLPKHN